MVVDCQGLPNKDSDMYHPYQNVMQMIDHIRANSQSMWQPGNVMTIDEARIKSKSSADIYKTHINAKPVRNGKDDFVIADCGDTCHGFTWSNLTACGNYTYTDTTHGKNFNIVDQLTGDEKVITIHIY